MDELIHIEVLNRHGEVTSRHAAGTLPVRIGRAYDNELVLDDPYVAPHHAVVERGPDGKLEIADAGSRNGLFRAHSRQRLTRERIDPAARYRAGRTEFRVRSSADPVPDELVDRGTGALRRPVVALLAVVSVAAVVLFYAWSGTDQRTELVKLATTPVLILLALIIWSGAWGLAGRLLSAERCFAAHLTVAALALIGIFVANRLDYVAFALSLSAPGADALSLFAVGGVLACGLWRHLALAIRHPGWGAALATVTVAAACVGSFVFFVQLDRADELAPHMAFLKVIKVPAVRLAQGSETGEFFQDSEGLKRELELLKGT
jgi:hypothetical protein